MSQVLGDMINHLQKHFFVGREQEVQLFLHHIKNKKEARILNIYGIGGVGKSTLLDELKRVAESQSIPFIQLDSHDFPHTMEGFTKRVLELCNNIPSFNQNIGENCINVLNTIAEKHSLILTIDTYEELIDLDSWLRERFIANLTSNILIILAGRTPLKGKWVTSPAWRSLIRSIELSPFSLEECRSYLEKFNLNEDHQLKQFYQLTQGHPLTLSLAVGLGNDFFLEVTHPELQHILQETTSQWLRELPDLKLSALVEATSIVRVFDRDMIEHILDTKVSLLEFHQLTSLSFFRKRQHGWSIHDLLRTNLLQEMQVLSPQKYKTYCLNALKYLLSKMKEVPEHDSTEFISELLFILGDSHIRSTYLDYQDEEKYFFVSVQQDNYKEASDYIKKLQDERMDLIDEFFDHITSERHSLVRPFAADEKLLNYINFEEFIRLGGDGAFLLKNESEETAGLMILLPIHQESVPYFRKKQVTRHYFNSLKANEIKKLMVPKHTPAGWFIYHIDLKGDNSAAARALSFQKLLLYLLRGGLFVFSTPITYMQETVKKIGFQETENFTHNDFGDGFAAPYFVLDLREEKRFLYANDLVQQAGISLVPPLPKELQSLTVRELEVAKSVLKYNTIADIAQALYITEITVKKHLSKLYEKLEVQGKSDLIKKLYDLGFTKTKK